MSWEQRKALIMSEVISLNSNVYLMQEVQHDHFLDFFEPLFHRSKYF
jgi:mRNA deadenylase 3'-5' endonuclease subunit Ccr4